MTHNRQNAARAAGLTRSDLRRATSEVEQLIRQRGVHQGVRLGMVVSLIPDWVHDSLIELVAQNLEDQSWPVDRWPHLHAWWERMPPKGLPEGLESGEDSLAWYAVEFPQPDDAALREAAEVLIAVEDGSLQEPARTRAAFVAHLAQGMALPFRDLEAQAARHGLPRAADWFTSERA